MAAVATPPSSTLLDYQLRLGAAGSPYDEMLQPNGVVRPHWQDVSAFLGKLGPREIGRRWNLARKILHDNGVAYNMQARGGMRAWELNPIPLRLAGGEWQSISRAIKQRARLLNLILNDAYGSQSLIKGGLLPPALIHGNAAYLRPCHGLPVQGDSRLTVYAADLCRAPDGTWWVLSDRTQAPSGMGYTLENRLVLSRVYPEIFRDATIARLGDFFTRFGASLAALSPRSGIEPNVVLLTPGPLNETYFEQAYLARHLGCPLVQGQDLAVRDGRVFIKTLEGLRQVDVILRRVDEDYCDPLELRDDSLLGVPGLMGAVRAGSVALANSLGSGLVQSAAFNAFLPTLCSEIFGEDLLMPSVATWWCGDRPAREYVLENLHGLVLKDAFEYPGSRPDRRLPLEKLREEVRRRPTYFAAQESVRLSQSPDFADGHLEARAILLRVFAVRSGDDYVVLPGGLTRVAEGESSYGVLLQQSGGSKDTWVEIEDAPATTSTPMLELRRTHLELTSRVADNLFWLGRYAERADFTARIVRCTLENFSEEGGWNTQQDLLPFLRTLRHFDQFVTHPAESPEDSLIRQMSDPSFPGSLTAIIQRLQALAATVRDQISNDTWRILNVLGDATIGGDQSGNSSLPLNDIILALSSFHGLLGENMPHGHAWRFLDLGRRLERALYLSRLTAEILRNETESRLGCYELLLETLDTLVTYRQKHASLRADAVLDLVLCDETHPRSLATQLVLAMAALAQLPHDRNSKTAEERRMLKALSDIRLLDTSEILSPTGRVQIKALLAQTEHALIECSDLITLRYFTHLRTSSVGRDTASPELPTSI